jgi:hypothetical protein
LVRDVAQRGRQRVDHMKVRHRQQFALWHEREVLMHTIDVG